MSLPSSFNSSNVIIIIMLLLVAADHSRLVDGILVVRDNTEQIDYIYVYLFFGSQEFQARSSSRRKHKRERPSVNFVQLLYISDT